MPSLPPVVSGRSRWPPPPLCAVLQLCGDKRPEPQTRSGNRWPELRLAPADDLNHALRTPTALFTLARPPMPSVPLRGRGKP